MLRAIFSLTLLAGLSACISPNTKTWPGVDIRKADAFREALYEHCKLYTNTQNMRPNETLADLPPKRFVPEDVIVMAIDDAQEQGSAVKFRFRGWNRMVYVDFERGLMKCNTNGEFWESPALRMYQLNK